MEMDCPNLTNIDINAWMNVPAMIERVATQEDVFDCRAVFSTDPGQTTRYSRVPVPARAIFTDENGVQHEVVIIQVEYAYQLQEKLVGYVIPGQGTGVGTLPEFEIVETK